MKNKTNAELIQLITDAAAELERRRVANELPATTTESGEDEEEEEEEEEPGGDRPPDPKFP